MAGNSYMESQNMDTGYIGSADKKKINNEYSYLACFLIYIQSRIQAKGIAPSTVGQYSLFC